MSPETPKDRGYYNNNKAMRAEANKARIARLPMFANLANVFQPC